MTALDEETIKATLRNQIRRDVQKRVAAKLGFLWHLALFLLANAAMYALNRAYSPDTLWFVWPLCGWGVGLLLHGIGILSGSRGRQMIEAEVERELVRRGLRG